MTSAFSQSIGAPYMSELRTPVIANPGNQRLWNRFGLTMSNGTVTLSVPALELLLNAAREEGPTSPPTSEGGA